MPVIAGKSIFKGLKDAKPSVDGNYERIGKYLERIDRIKVDNSRKGDAFVAVEKTVVRVLDDAQGQGHKVGEQVTHMMMPKHDSFLGNIKGMLASLLEMKPEEIGEEAAEMVCDEKQPLAGMLIECHNHIITTKKGAPFTVIHYLHEVKPPQALQTLTADEITRFFPGEYLQKIAAGQPAVPPVAAPRVNGSGGTPTPTAPAPTPMPAPDPNTPVPCAQPAGYGPAPAGYQFAIKNGAYVFIPV